MGIIKEFREFALKGNVIDMAVGVIIGAAFGAVVSSMVADVMMPPLGWAIGQVDFSDLSITLAEATPKLNADGTPKLGPDGKPMVIPEVVIKYGMFINALIKFAIQAFAVFLLIKLINTARKRFEKEQAVAPAAPPAPTKEQVLLTEIRDLLAARR